MNNLVLSCIDELKILLAQTNLGSCGKKKKTYTGAIQAAKKKKEKEHIQAVRQQYPQQQREKKQWQLLAHPKASLC